MDDTLRCLLWLHSTCGKLLVKQLIGNLCHDQKVDACSGVPCLQNISSTSNFAMVSAVWLRTANASTHLVRSRKPWNKQQHICFHSLLEAGVRHPLLYSVKRSTHFNGLEWRSAWFARTFSCGTCQAGTTMMSNIRPHAFPPVFLSKGVVHLTLRDHH